MKRFLIRLVLFFIGSLIVLSTVYLVKYDIRFAYHSLKKDYLKAGWIYQQVFESKQPIDIAFVGTSHTINGVNDSLLNAKLSGHSRTVNLALHGHGLNMQYKLMKDLVKHKKPQAIFLEVRETESRVGHFAFPIIAENEDLQEMPLLFNPTVLTDVRSSFQARVDYIKQVISGTNPVSPSPWTAKKYGHVPLQQYPTPAKMQKAKADYLAVKQWFVLGENMKEVEYKFAYIYLEKIKRLADINKLRLYFLYLPYYQAPKLPIEATLYQQYGTLVIPPRHILDNPVYWGDITHLNEKGAEQLSLWLSDYLKTK